MKLLDRNQETRLGAKNDAAEILSHPVFDKNFIDQVNKKQMKVDNLPMPSHCIDLNQDFDTFENKASISDRMIPADKALIE